ncbi:hypothetical protein ABPG75_005490 [Micractinium tetrahymenae]
MALALWGAAPVAGSGLDCSTIPDGPPSPSPSFLVPVKYKTIGNNRIAYRLVSNTCPQACFRGGQELVVPPPPLVLVPGYGWTIASWGTRFLRRLARNHDLILFDSPAQGLSTEIVPSNEPLGRDVLRQTIRAFLESLGLPRLNLAGWSIGGTLALAIAAENPPWLNKVVSFGGFSFDSKAVLGDPSVLQPFFNPTNTNEDDAPYFFNTTPRQARQRRLIVDCRQLGREDRWIADVGAMPSDPPKPEANLRYSTGLVGSLIPGDTSVWEALAQTRVPIFLMGGTDDVLIPKAAQLGLVQQIPDAWLAQFPGTGHAFQAEKVEEVVSAMDAFLLGGAPCAGSSSGCARFNSG